MSKENLQAFAEAVSKSEELQKQLTSIQVEAARSTADQIAKLSERAGIVFTAEEYLQSVAQSAEELSAEQLHTVAGGAWDPNVDNILTSIFSLGLKCAVQAVRSAAEGNIDQCAPSKERRH
jgi:predicted ribosomally synthesized peptide with nif11-like leader